MATGDRAGDTAAYDAYCAACERDDEAEAERPMLVSACRTVAAHEGRAYDAVQISCEEPDFCCFVLYDDNWQHQPDDAPSIIGERPLTQLWRIADDLLSRKLASAEYEVDGAADGEAIVGRWRFKAEVR